MFLDFASTNSINNIWIETVINCNSKQLFGNPGSYHKYGFNALEMMEQSTKNILNTIFKSNDTANLYDICYNSGSTESINQFIYAVSNIPKTLIIYENIAHKAVLNSIKRYFPNDYFELDFGLHLDDNLSNFENTLQNIDKNKYDKFVLVLTSVNNETGGIWNHKLIEKLNRIICDYKDSYFFNSNNYLTVFLDHTQGFTKYNEFLDLVDAFCFSAHKIGGMKGFGGLVYKKSLKDILKEYPLIVGGYDIRGGTKDPISVKALDNLIKYKYNNSDTYFNIVTNLRKKIIDKINEIASKYNIPVSFNEYSSLFNGQSPYIINASFIGIEGESLMSCLMDDCISTGSACNSSELKASHVILGMGRSKINANCAFRISLSEEINEYELDTFLNERFEPAIKFLSRMRTRHEGEK